MAVFLSTETSLYDLNRPKAGPGSLAPVTGSTIKQLKIYWVGLMGDFHILVLMVEQTIATKWQCNWSEGLILGAFYTTFRA